MHRITITMAISITTTQWQVVIAVVVISSSICHTATLDGLWALISERQQCRTSALEHCRPIRDLQCSALPVKAAPILQAGQSKEAVAPAGALLMGVSCGCATCSRSSSTHPSRQQPLVRLVAPDCTFLCTFLAWSCTVNVCSTGSLAARPHMCNISAAHCVAECLR